MKGVIQLTTADLIWKLIEHLLDDKSKKPDENNQND